MTSTLRYKFYKSEIFCIYKFYCGSVSSGSGSGGPCCGMQCCWFIMTKSISVFFVYVQFGNGKSPESVWKLSSRLCFRVSEPKTDTLSWLQATTNSLSKSVRWVTSHAHILLYYFTVQYCHQCLPQKHSMFSFLQPKWSNVSLNVPTSVPTSIYMLADMKINILVSTTVQCHFSRSQAGGVLWSKDGFLESSLKLFPKFGLF